MRINKFKGFLISTYCIMTALCSEAKCMDDWKQNEMNNSNPRVTNLRSDLEEFEETLNLTKTKAGNLGFDNEKLGTALREIGKAKAQIHEGDNEFFNLWKVQNTNGTYDAFKKSMDLAKENLK